MSITRDRANLFTLSISKPLSSKNCRCRAGLTRTAHCDLTYLIPLFPLGIGAAVFFSSFINFLFSSLALALGIPLDSSSSLSYSWLPPLLSSPRQSSVMPSLSSASVDRPVVRSFIW
ncbi:hypothetical protein M9H77_19104 [Catharanthus roseus]|uniref:Uncharacterized protein n=1 Tax=Catharanthus roseus TaxID=4058 RepID=A0ACC0B9D4_CATRO|nr:hypothetical protein M9H77_19104 [Catharanthus roseus]